MNNSSSEQPAAALGPSPVAAGDAQISLDEARAAISEALSAAICAAVGGGGGGCGGGAGGSAFDRSSDSAVDGAVASAVDSGVGSSVAEGVSGEFPALGGVESVPLMLALGRVLACDVLSPIDVPAHDNSAMDGYAFDGAALAAGQPLTLQAVGTAVAGPPFEGCVTAGQCLRIMTGAVMPAGLDTVVPLELCQVDGDPVHDTMDPSHSAQSAHSASSANPAHAAHPVDLVHPLHPAQPVQPVHPVHGFHTVHIAPGAVQRGENTRQRGEDLACGKPALQAGRMLRPADVGLVASLGLATVPVRPRLRVAVFSTGDELRSLGQPLDPGCVYDSNRYALMAALQRLGMDVLDLGVVRDDPAALRATLETAIAGSDAVLTSGGVSAGDADHTRALLAQMGEVVFWKVAMRPGRPFAFGPVQAHGRRSWLFALPGNPVAALVTFYALVRGGLLQLAGATAEPLPVLQARCVQGIRKRPGRTELQRGLLSRAEDGHWQVQVAASQGSGILRSMSQANALVVIGPEQGSVPAGGLVDVWLFDGLV